MSKIVGVLVIWFLLLFLWVDNVAARCWVWTTSVDFGSYDVFSATPLDSTGAISVFCNRRTFVTGSIGASPNSGGFDPRQMKLSTGPDLLNYNLFRDPARTQIWGDGTGGADTVSGTVPRFGTVNRNIYGRIPPGQDISAGHYTETITVTINY